MFEKYLQEIGLADKEAAIYLALLQVDSTPVAALAKKTKIKRPTVYVVLESLAKKGLVSETTVGKKTQYQAEPPERLKTFVERQKILLEEREQRLDDIIPQIKNLQRESGERPVVKFFDGKIQKNEDKSRN
jgi:sugar-specific transcriptional regulator TrmB